MGVSNLLTIYGSSVGIVWSTILCEVQYQVRFPPIFLLFDLSPWFYALPKLDVSYMPAIYGSDLGVTRS